MTDTTNVIEINKDVIKKRKETENNFTGVSFLFIILIPLTILYFNYVVGKIVGGNFYFWGDDGSVIIIGPFLLLSSYFNSKAVISEFKNLECGPLSIFWLVMKPWAYIAGGFLALCSVVLGVYYFAIWIGVEAFVGGLVTIVVCLFILFFGTGDSLKP